MELPIPKTWKQIWDTWDIRVFIILSLSLQSFLILFAPLRKRISSPWLIMLTWSAYLLADWAANFAVGLISNNPFDQKPQQQDDPTENLLAFWAPFLLVHLGGPDTITAFALEDNELWLRHLFGLVFQSVAAFYIFFQSLPKNRLWVPTMLMFLAGIIKYCERTRSLYLASLDRFRDSMLTDPDPEYNSKKKAKLPTRIQEWEPPRESDQEWEPPRESESHSASKVKEGRIDQEWEFILYAYRFFKTFKCLIVDLMFSTRERNQSREFFLRRTAEEAFRIVEVELNFIYEVLFTKASVIFTTYGYIGRFLSFTCTVISLVLFSLEEKKAKYDAFDVGITYMLLGGAIALDLIAFIMLICSDRFVVATRKLPEPDALEEQAAAQQESPFLNCFGGFRRFFRRRWSESISTFNLIYYCLHPRTDVQEGILDFFGMTSYLDSFKYVEQKPFTDELRVHIFTEFSRNSEIADDLESAKKISATRGDWILRFDGCRSLLPYILDVDYDESLLLWHIATELCYNDESDQNNSSNKYRDFSKVLSDYMMYLLVMQPTMMSAVTGIGQIRFRDTCAEAKKFFRLGNQKMKTKKPRLFQMLRYVAGSIFRYFLWYLYLLVLSLTVVITSPLLIIPQVRGIMLVQAAEYHGRVMEYLGREKKIEEELRKACEDILKVNTEVKPVAVKGDRSKSVLFNACILTKELQKLEKSEEQVTKLEKWEIMSKVWVELLCYAAIHCRANSLAQQLSKGGELITIVWLLMAHFGLGDQLLGLNLLSASRKGNFLQFLGRKGKRDNMSILVP